ncbi:hypothetical protein SDC9_102963 [bioreactor metagenome]|uniref:Uncharacterized protein n=1 Tax=bioreactor metagenome TaxID=1076179 RepID=A0A645ASB1_9ZZZZ
MDIALKTMPEVEHRNSIEPLKPLFSYIEQGFKYPMKYSYVRENTNLINYSDKNQKNINKS